MTNNKISAEANLKGGKLEITGSNAGRIASQIADLISPFSELAGATGDHVRIWRAKSLIKSLERAHQIAREHNITIDKVAPKFLASWVEKASLEDDDQLTERWANLLLSSVGQFDVISSLSSNILSEIGAMEARLMEHLYFGYLESDKNHSLVISSNTNHYIGWQHYHRACEAIVNKIFDEAELSRNIEERKNQIVDRAINYSNIYQNKGGPLCINAVITDRSEDILARLLLTTAEQDTQMSQYYLISKGLMEKVLVDDPQKGLASTLSQKLQLDCAKLTDLGLEFVKKVSRPHVISDPDKI